MPEYDFITISAYELALEYAKKELTREDCGKQMKQMFAEEGLNVPFRTYQKIANLIRDDYRELTLRGLSKDEMEKYSSSADFEQRLIGEIKAIITEDEF